LFPRRPSKEEAKGLGKQRVQQQEQEGATGPLADQILRSMLQTDLFLVPVSLNPFLCIKTGSLKKPWRSLRVQMALLNPWIVMALLLTTIRCNGGWWRFSRNTELR
jgi:hypothetical protein